MFLRFHLADFLRCCCEKGRLHFFRYLSVSLLFLVAACKNYTEDEASSTVSFNTGFRVSPRFSGIYVDKVSGDELLFFAEPVTRKCIKRFTLNGEFKDSVLLGEAKKYLGKIDRIRVISVDTIILCSVETNRVAFVDRNGRCWKKLDLGPILFREQCKHYSLSAMDIERNSLYFHLSWQVDVCDLMDNKIPVDHFENSRYRDRQIFNSPYLLRINNIFSDSLSYKFGLDSFYSNISSKPKAFVEDANFLVDEEFIIVYSKYSNSVFLVDSGNLRVAKKWNLESPKTKIGIEALDAEVKHNVYLQDKIQLLLDTKGYVIGVYRDGRTRHLLVLVNHEVDVNSSNGEKGVHRPFSLMIFDQQLVKRDEKIFAGDLLQSNFCLMSAQGLLIHHQNKANEKRNETFSVFRF